MGNGQIRSELVHISKDNHLYFRPKTELSSCKFFVLLLNVSILFLLSESSFFFTDAVPAPWPQFGSWLFLFYHYNLNFSIKSFKMWLVFLKIHDYPHTITPKFS